MAHPTLDDLFTAHYGYVFQSLRRLGVPARDIEDVVHEVFVAVYRSLKQYDPSRPIRPWLFAFAYNAASVYRRKAYVRREKMEEVAEPAVSEQSPESAALQSQLRTLLLDALESVNEERRAVLILHDIDETPMPQVAEALGIPLNTGYSRLRLARQELSDAVKALKAKRGSP